MRPCNLFPQLASGAGDISNKVGHYADPVFAPGHWCFARITETATGVLRREHAPGLFSRCGRAGKESEPGTGMSPRITLDVEQASRQVTKPEHSPSRDPDDVGELSSMFHPRRWRCLMKTRTKSERDPKVTLLVRLYHEGLHPTPTIWPFPPG